jgi:metal-responsive CopG/Arc/MetJ family transcriptional regulator
MKTAVSLPDPLFEAAERVAARLGLSRSQLYARAIARFVREQSGDAITEAINRVVRKNSTGLDPVLARLQAASLAADEGGFEDWVSVPKARRRGKAKRG